MTNIIIHFSDGTSFDHETQKVGKDAIWEAIAAACRVCSDDTITEIEVVNG